MSFDIVIPLGPKEISRFDRQIEYTKKNILGYRNIYIVTCNTNIQINDWIIINEEAFPFKKFIENYFSQHNGKSNRTGWYFQQLIKLYAGKIIENILESIYTITTIDIKNKILVKYLYSVNSTEITITTRQYNMSFQDIIYNKYQQWQVGNTGTASITFNR